MTTSRAQADVSTSYELGVSSFIQKPVSFEKLVDIIKTFEKYWLHIVKLPESSQKAQKGS